MKPHRANICWASFGLDGNAFFIFALTFSNAEAASFSVYRSKPSDERQTSFAINLGDFAASARVADVAMLQSAASPAGSTAGCSARCTEPDLLHTYAGP